VFPSCHPVKKRRVAFGATQTLWENSCFRPEGRKDQFGLFFYRGEDKADF